MDASHCEVKWDEVVVLLHSSAKKRNVISDVVS